MVRIIFIQPLFMQHWLRFIIKFLIYSRLSNFSKNQYKFLCKFCLLMMKELFRRRTYAKDIVMFK